MIERQGLRIEQSCDGCGTPGPSGVQAADDFDVVIADAKQAGWLVTREHSQWRHYCPDCRDEVEDARER